MPAARKNQSKSIGPNELRKISFLNPPRSSGGFAFPDPTFSSAVIPRILIAFTAAVFAVRVQAESSLDQTIERIFGTQKEFEPKAFGPAVWREDGKSYTTLESSAEKKSPKEIVRYDAESGQREVLVSAAQLTPAKPEAKPLAIEHYAWSKDGQRLLLFTNAQKVWRQKTRGDYWVLDRTSGNLHQLGGPAPAASLMFAKFSPDSSRVAYVRAGNLYVEQLKSGVIQQLTTDGSATVTNGSPDWVNEEELGIRDGFRWSDDSRSLAYWQFDTAGVRDFTILNNTAGLYPQLTQFPYPKPGTQNSAVRVGVVAAAGGKTRWMSLPGEPRDRYVARISWVKGTNELVLHQLNRRQTQLDVFVGDARTGKLRPLFQDRDLAWVSVREQTLWTHDGNTLLILSERSGWQQAYAVSRLDQSVRLVTPQPFDVISLVGTDAKDEWLYYMASPENPTQRYLYRARLDGVGPAERVTPASQPGTHTYTSAPDSQLSIHTYSRFAQPTVTDLVRLPSHEIVRALEDNQPLKDQVADLVRPAEFFTVAAGTEASLDGWMIKPRDFDAGKKYPVIVFVYGEAASVTVTDAWNLSRVLFHSALADAGYIILSLDNRGTPAPKGREWRKAFSGEGNAIAVKDQTAALKHLLHARPYLDASRVGVWGHSGGGANTLNLLFRSPETYHVGVASAPVSDVHYYDSIYQERYLGLPDQNTAGYRAASPINFAEGLKGKLLLVHGAADDNVHFQNSELLINRLVELQKPFDLMVYPNGSHALTEGKGYAVHRYRLIARYFQTHLPSGGRPAAAP